jgi:hypothetical protein
VFVLLGLLLEGLHGFKAAIYLDVGQGTRRLMWRLAHAHGTLLGLVNIALAASAGSLAWSDRRRDLASMSLRAATLMMPAGFFLGGLHFHGDDPGVGVLLVPVGGVLLVVAIGLVTHAVIRSP